MKEGRPLVKMLAGVPRPEPLGGVRCRGFPAHDRPLGQQTIAPVRGFPHKAKKADEALC